MFPEPIVTQDEAGKWTLSCDNGKKLMAVCYFMLHRKVFAAAEKTAAQVFDLCGRNTTTFIDTVREAIWRVHGASGKKNCPSHDALRYQVRRCCAVLEYWQAAFDENMELPEFRGEGWATASGSHDDDLTTENVVLHLSDYALLGKEGKLKS